MHPLLTFATLEAFAFAGITALPHLHAVAYRRRHLDLIFGAAVCVNQPRYGLLPGCGCLQAWWDGDVSAQLLSTLNREQSVTLREF